MRVVGICIPWHRVHVTTMKHLRPILEDFLTHSEPLIVVGDWNQRIPPPGTSKSEAQLAWKESRLRWRL